MIRVLHFAGIINRYDIIDTVLTRLDRSQFNIQALTGVPARRSAAYAAEEAYPVKVCGFPFTRRHAARMFYELMRMIGQFRPHIVQAHHFDENVVAAAAAQAARVPCTIIGRHYSNHIYYLSNGLRRQAWLAAENWCNRSASAIAVPTQEVASLLVKQGVSERKIAVIPFGVDIAGFQLSSADSPRQLRKQFALEDKFVVLACGRLSREKGLADAIAAMPKVLRGFPQARLVLVGSGPCEGVLRQQVSQLGIQAHVLFVGWRNDALDWVAASDAVVQASYCESFCQVLMEALAFNKPVIMTPVGAAPEVIGENERGHLVPLGNPGAISAALIEVIAHRDVARQKAEAGRAYALSRFDSGLAARRYGQLYQAALKGRQPFQESISATSMAGAGLRENQESTVFPGHRSMGLR